MIAEKTTVEFTDIYNNTTPADTTVFSVDEIGNVSIGPNKQVQANPGPYAVGPNGFCDFVYSAKSRSLFAANLRLRMVGDPVDLAIGMAAGSPLHDGVPQGIQAGADIGRIYWQGFQAEGYFNNGSAAIGCRAMEAFTNYGQGAELIFATTPIGQTAMRQAMIITPFGQTMLRVYAGPPELGGNYPPTDSMFPPQLLGGGLMYWDDGHNKLWIRRGSGQWVSAQCL